jgi:hypothetical protein
LDEDVASDEVRLDLYLGCGASSCPAARRAWMVTSGLVDALMGSRDRSWNGYGSFWFRQCMSVHGIYAILHAKHTLRYTAALLGFSTIRDLRLKIARNNPLGVVSEVNHLSVQGRSGACRLIAVLRTLL